MEKQQENKRYIEFDAVFDIVNTFGLYQKILYFSVNCLKLPMGVQFGFLIFAFGTPPFHCTTANITCPIKKCCENCTSYAFKDVFTSTVTEWNLICDRAYIAAAIQSSFFGGMLFGSAIGGLLSDTFGRKKCIFINCFFMASASLGSAFADSNIVSCVLRFATGFFHASLIISQYTFLIELVGPKKRTMAGKTTGFFWQLGNSSILIIVYFLPNWRHTVIVGSLFGFVFPLFYKFVIALVFFAMLLFVSQLTGNIFINVILMHLVDIPSIYISWIAVLKFGRRLPFFMFCVLAAIMLLSFPFIPKKFALVTTALALLGRAFIGANFNNVYLITSELYPTVIRNIAIGTGSMTARCGAILSPYLIMMAQLPGLSITFPMCIFGGLAIVAAITALFLPETLFANMHQSIEQTEEAVLDYSVPCCGKPTSRSVKVPYATEKEPLTEKDEDEIVEAVSTV